MKKFFLTAFVLLISLTAMAQDKGDWGIGPKINIYTHTGDGAIFGIGGYFRHNFSDAIRLETSVIIPCKSGCSVDFGCEIQYLFRVARDWNIFPLAGINANDLGKWSCGIDLGAGFDYKIARHWSTSAGVSIDFRPQDSQKIRSLFPLELHLHFN